MDAIRSPRSRSRPALALAGAAAIVALAAYAIVVGVRPGTGFSGPPPPDVRRYDVAELARVPDADGPRATLPGPEARWEPVTLPDTALRGAARGLETRWYRLLYDYDGGSALALYVPRITYTIGPVVEYRVDGTLLDDRLSYGGIARWVRPEFVPLPRALVPPGQPRTVEVLIGLRIDPGRGFAITPPWIGPREQLYPLYVARDFALTGLPQVTAYALLVLGGFALLFWARRREPAYLLFALASAVWWLRTLHYWAVETPLPAHGFWWVTVNSLSWLMVLVYLFAFRFAERRRPRVEAALVLLVVAVAIGTAGPVAPNLTFAGTLAYSTQALVALGVTGLLTAEAVRSGRGEIGLLAAALWLNLAFGVHDLLLREGRLDADRLWLMPYGALALFAAFLYAVHRRYVGAIDEVERANAALEHRLAARTRELDESYARLRVIEREQTLAAERQRLMRDMHDGLGSSLMSSLVMVEQGRLQTTDVARVLRECIDDLKLTIDSLEPLDSDLVTLLATLRYRLGRRLEAAGLRLDWKVADLPRLPWLDALSALEVLRILQEVLTNVIKHSGAKSVTISTAVDGNEVRVRLADDGRGFDVALARTQASGRGLLNLERRASRIGGRVDLQSSPAGTIVELVLPIERRADATDGPPDGVGERRGVRADAPARPATP